MKNSQNPDRINRIAVLTSGGDSPGMNAAIRAVVRTGIHHGLDVMGIMRGYEGMIDNELIDLKSQSVSNIIQRGGTILKSARSERFFDSKFRRQAFENLQKRKIDGVVVIGGDGSFRGALALSDETSLPFIGIPGTIDNDLFGTDFTVGYDTAINTVVEAIDKIRDTADSHERLFFVEVMGRDAGFIAWVNVALMSLLQVFFNITYNQALAVTAVCSDLLGPVRVTGGGHNRCHTVFHCDDGVHHSGRLGVKLRTDWWCGGFEGKASCCGQVFRA